MTITAAVDGSSLGNPGPAGWAWVISEKCWDAGGWKNGTNNLGELTAIKKILEATALAGLADEPLHLLADSQYAIKVIDEWMPLWKKKGWKKKDGKPIANLELIQSIDNMLSNRKLTFEWVKGHSGNPMNEMADTHARAAATAYRDCEPYSGGPGISGVATEKIV